MDGSGGPIFHCTNMSPGLDDWRQEVSRSSSSIKQNRCRNICPGCSLQMEGGPNDTSSFYVAGKSQAGMSHLHAYHGADSYRIAEGSSSEMLIEKQDYVKVVDTLSNYIPDRETRDPRKFERKGIQSSRGFYAARASRPLLSVNADCRFNPRLKENFTGMLTLPSLKLENPSGISIASSIGGRREEGLPKENENGQSLGLLERVAKVDERLTIDEGKTTRAFKFFLVEYIKDLLKPYWKLGILSKDAHKIIAKKTVNKVIRSFGSSQVPQTKSLSRKYLSHSRHNLDKLVQDAALLMLQ